ncbi:MAG: universal stress protein UspA [Gammaproteobacteria bacterium BRH_c0]|nr:MAG: universal stress protein UspA [Gammaproteobacteria bacterium BRH_c0]
MDTHRTTVLACIDGSTWKEAVVDYAAWVSRTVDAPLKLLHNIEHRENPPLSDLSGSLGLGTREELLQELTALEERRSKILLEQGKLMLEGSRQRAIAAGASDPVKVQRHGSLTESLIEMEDEIRVLVVGIRGEDHENRLNRIGDQLEGIIRAMHRPLLVVNRPFEKPPTRCMIAYDGSDGARKALDMVANSPLYKGMQCHLVHVSKSAESPLLDDAAAKLRGAGLEVVTASLQGDVERQLGEYQQQHQVELTVMGAFAHGRLRELLFGSVTNHLLANSTMPLLLLR